MPIAAQLSRVLLLWLLFSTVSCQVYDYSNGTNGPANWGNISGWETCGNGTQQSPINFLLPLNVAFRKPLDVNYTSAIVASEIYNNGHSPTVEVLERDVAVLNISGVKYELQDFHFHIPSEHKILNIRFAMEQHLVHKSADGKTAVIGLLYIVGPASAFLAQFVGDLPMFSPPNVRTPINITLPPLQYFSYYQYNGSLTTPPCNEGVAWIVLKRVYTLSLEQLQLIRASLPEENARPIQARNGRTVNLFSKI